MRIGLTYDLKESWMLAFRDDTFAEFDAEGTVEAIRCALENLGYETVCIGSARQILNILPELCVDIVFNISEGGTTGRCREAYAPALLEMWNIPYVGSGPATLAISLDKLMTKRIAVGVGLLVPDERHFPFIVKPRYEGSAKGICRDSLVFDQHELQNQIDRIRKIYNQPALVEEFIAGWEFTVAVIGNDPPVAFAPLQRAVDKTTTLANHIIDKSQGSEVRGQRSDDVEEFLVPLSIDEELEERLKKDAVTIYQALGCRDFARADFRVGFDGKVYFLEINPLPSLAKDDSFAILSECLNISYDDMIGRIITEALKRYDLAPAVMI